MTSAQYKDLNVNVSVFQRTLLAYVKQAGWQVKDEVTDQVTATFTLKKGLLNTTVVKVRGVPHDLFVEIVGASAVMDLVEQAIAASCEKPTGIIGWRDQIRLRSPSRRRPQHNPLNKVHRYHNRDPSSNHPYRNWRRVCIVAHQ